MTLLAPEGVFLAPQGAGTQIRDEAEDIGHEFATGRGQHLNRVISTSHDGFGYDPDIRYAELIVKELGLEKAKSVSTPWKEEHHDSARGNSFADNPAKSAQAR